MKTINELVYGHAQAKKVLQVLLKRSQDRYYKKCVKGETDVRDTLKCLLIGPSGTGKTHLMQSMSKLYNFPLICLDATHLTPTGNAEGMNVKQLKKLIDDTCQQMAKKPEFPSPEGVLNQLVIFVDEFDKLASSFESTGRWNQHVQANFLTMIDNKEEFAGISWVFAGAFAGLFKNRGKGIGIGFFEAKNEAIKEITEEDIIKAGIIPELLGRISLIVQLDTFTKEDFKKVLVERLLPCYNLTLNGDVIDAIVTKAYNSEQGIRSMTRQLEMLSIDEEFLDDEDIMAISFALK